MEAILAAQLEVPFWCSFRVPYTVNVHFTYPIPPITTLKGLVACALGYASDQYEMLDELSFGVGLEEPGQLVESFSKIIKWDRRDREMRTLVMRQKILQPTFLMYVKGNQEQLQEIKEALENPYFPLSLGEGDDPVEIAQVDIFPLQTERGCKVDNCVPVHMGKIVGGEAQVVHLPMAFDKDQRGKWSGVQYQSYYVASSLILDKELEVYRLGNRKILL